MFDCKCCYGLWVHRNFRSALRFVCCGPPPPFYNNKWVLLLEVFLFAGSMLQFSFCNVVGNIVPFTVSRTLSCMQNCKMQVQDANGKRLENEDLMCSSDHRSYVVFVVCGGEKKLGGKFRSKKKGRGLYTKGELNKLIDSLCHPLFETDEGFILVDGLLHAMVEQDPPVTVKKFKVQSA